MDAAFEEPLYLAPEDLDAAFLVDFAMLMGFVKMNKFAFEITNEIIELQKLCNW